MNLYKEITFKIIEALENDIIPWRCPFKRCALPTNYKTSKQYNGINTIILWLENNLKGYTSHYWLGYGQAKQLNGNVKKGEKATKIIAYCETKKGKEREDESDSKNNAITHFFRAESVFNLDQIEGIDFKSNNENVFEVADANELTLKTGAIIKHKGDSAYYDPLKDFINMPLKSKFENTKGYYSTLFHELIHWTGHKNRLNRLSSQTSKDRALEELVAEIGASFLCAEYGISLDVSNSSSYIASWLKALKNDHKYIQEAIKSANLAINYLKKSE